MSADLSQPMLPSPAPRRRALVSLAIIALAALALAGFFWRLQQAIQASHRRSEAFMKQAVPAGERFVSGLAAADWKTVRGVTANQLKDSFTDSKAKKLLAAHPELSGPATLLGFSFRGALGPTFADFFGVDQAHLDATCTFRYQLSKPGAPQGPTLSFEVRWEQGEARVSRALLDGQELAAPDDRR